MTAPNDPAPAADQPESTQPPAESRTRIIRRAPTGPLPTIADTPDHPNAPPRADAQDATRAAPQVQLPDAPTAEPSNRTAVAACAVTIVSGWATSVVATALVTGYWSIDRLFSVAVAFLVLVFAATAITGVIMLLQHRSIGRHLIVAGAVVALLTYASVFIAGAQNMSRGSCTPFGCCRWPAWCWQCTPGPNAGWGRLTLARFAPRVLDGDNFAQIPPSEHARRGEPELQLAERGVVVHQLHPAGAAEVDQRHRRFADAGDFLDPTQPVLVVGHPVTGPPSTSSGRLPAPAGGRRARRTEPAGAADRAH